MSPEALRLSQLGHQAEPCLQATRSPLLTGSVMRKKIQLRSVCGYMCRGREPGPHQREANLPPAKGIILIEGCLVQGVHGGQASRGPRLGA